MKNLLFTFFATALLFSCNNKDSTKETAKAVVAADSGWATSHLKGMVHTIEEVEYTPDEKGEIGEMDSCCVEVREYNGKGYTIKYSEKDSKGTVTTESKYERIDGAKLKSIVRTENGKQVWGRTIHRDDDGNALYAADTDTTGQIHRIHSIIEENEIGQSLLGKTHTADSTYLGTWSFKYIDGMRAGRGWIDNTDKQIVDNTGELNDKGLLSKMERKGWDDEGNPTITVSTYTYDSFDDKGNWTQCTTKEDGKVVEVEKRTYTYFK